MHLTKQKKQDNLIQLNYNGVFYLVPEQVLQPYKQAAASKADAVSAHEVFAKMDREQTRSGALLKGLRCRENMTQIQFAKKIGITQANLSSMEHGRRAIGKDIAKRIQAVFKVDYRYFLE
ncbi:MAG: helix-turn-helix domain-containing protein [Gammaproteobacteria bacterium]